MRWPTRSLVLFAVSFLAPGGLAYAQADKPADDGTRSASAGATKEEVEQLRREVAELKATIQQLVEANRQGADVGARLVPAVALRPATPAASAAIAEPGQQAPQKKAGETPTVTAGWNGEHFFVKSSDGKFQIQPYGYIQTDYRAYQGDGVPPDTFTLRRARFGFQGSYGTHYDFAILADPATTSGAVIRDVYLTIKPYPEFQVQVGQFKEPFAQEVTTAVTNIDFVERALTSLLYPAAATAFRSPGALVFGNLHKGVMQYWVGAFNGKGIATANTSNEPEVIGRLRFYPWKQGSNEWLKGFAFGGSIGHGRSRALSGETSFSGTLPDAAYNFFPSFKINGPVERYNGEFTWIKGPWAVRGEYDQLNQFRRAVGSETTGGTAPGFATLPGVVAKAWYASATYLLTGETRPENGTPKVKHPWLGPETPGGGLQGWGAWEAKFRYEKIQAKAAGASFASPVSPTAVPTFFAHTDEFTAGINWYPNYWVRYMLDLNVDRAKNPTVGGLPAQNFFVVLQRLQFRF